MSFVRRQLTLLLLEVTTDEMTQVAKESIVRAKHKGIASLEIPREKSPQWTYCSFITAY